MLSRSATISTLIVTVGAMCCAAAQVQERRYFQIRVVDKETGRGVPLVELETIHHLHYVTDNNGVVAFYEPGLMGQEVYFHVRSHGYEYPADGFGFRGVRLRVEPGGKAVIQLVRKNIAERLYRITGAGLYVDSVLTGYPVPRRQGLLNAQVLGQDSVLQAVYRGKIYWFWGDTLRLNYPLGNFHATAATSALPGPNGADIEQGLDLDYLTGPDGFVKGVCPMPGKGPTWITAVMVIQQDGTERLYAGYAKVRGFLDIYQRGLAIFNDDKQEFQPLVIYPEDAVLYPDGHTFIKKENGQDYIYFGNPFPLIRVPAKESCLRDGRQFESYTCLVPGNTATAARLDRNAEGKLNYAWKRNTPLLKGDTLKHCVRQGWVKPHELLIQLRDIETGKHVEPHSGSVYWNPWRRKWIGIILEQGGTSFLGEVWYAEADTPTGPWVYARKIVSHDKYSFYNPKHHPIFDREGGRIIYFEGTFTTMFSRNERPVPRYEYNQILYRLDLGDPRLILPVPVYATLQDGQTRYRVSKLDSDFSPSKIDIAFFALDRPSPGAVPVYQLSDQKEWRLTLDKLATQGEPIFYALPAESPERPGTFLLYEYTEAKTGRKLYAGKELKFGAGLDRAERPLCRVWESPYSARPEDGPGSKE